MQHKTLCKNGIFFSSGIHIEFEWIRKGMLIQINNLDGYLPCTLPQDYINLTGLHIWISCSNTLFLFILILRVEDCRIGVKSFCLEGQILDMSTVIHHLNLSWCGVTVAQPHLLFSYLIQVCCLPTCAKWNLTTAIICIFVWFVYFHDRCLV